LAAKPLCCWGRHCRPSEPLGTYEELARNAETVTFGDKSLKVIGLDDLIRIKKHLRRNKDLAAIIQLEALKQIREQEKGGSVP
jgi:hypothetical protein